MVLDLTNWNFFIMRSFLSLDRVRPSSQISHPVIRRRPIEEFPTLFPSTNRPIAYTGKNQFLWAKEKESTSSLPLLSVETTLWRPHAPTSLLRAIQPSITPLIHQSLYSSNIPLVIVPSIRQFSNGPALIKPDSLRHRFSICSAVPD